MPVAVQYLPSGYETASEAFVGQDINPALSEASALSLSHGAVGQDVELGASLDWKIQSLPILDNLVSPRPSNQHRFLVSLQCVV